MPQSGKICNFDCIYCECGWNADGRTSDGFPCADAVAQALEAKLCSMEQEGSQLDSITFSGHGEPTLHPEFAKIVDITVSLRDRFFPQCRISVLSNATMLHRSDVLAALKKVDNPILKLDGPSNESVAVMNRPQGKYDVEAVIEGMKAFGGDFVLQTMMLGGAAFDFRRDDSALSSWKETVRMLHPREIMVYTLDRPSPQKGLEKLSKEEMELMLSDLIEEGLNVKIY